jgi:hypothetical protein
MIPNRTGTPFVQPPWSVEELDVLSRERQREGRSTICDLWATLTKILLFPKPDALTVFGPGPKMFRLIIVCV